MKLKTKLQHIDAGKPIVVLNEEDAKELGVNTSDRIKISIDENTTTAIVNTTKLSVGEGEIGVFDEVEHELSIKDGDILTLEITKRPKSIDFIRKMMHGVKLNDFEIRAIVSDIVDDKLSDIETTAFVVSSYINPYDINEIVSLANAMVDTGEKIDFGSNVIDKHCIGGVAGNRTTMLLVPILAAAGFTVPKTSSRAITSASGTADTMEVLSCVSFNSDEIKTIVKKTGGCIVWSGSINLAPADDKIIRVRYPLSLDPKSQLLASIMSKKKSIGADYLIVDIPVGKGAKIKESSEGRDLAYDFINVGKRMDIVVKCLITDGNSPIGRGIGPALEAIDVLLALENKGKGPSDLINKSLDMAAAGLELAGKPAGREIAEEILISGQADEKMREIIEAQGGNPDVKVSDICLGSKTYVVKSDRKGSVRRIDNKGINLIARAAGAPKDKGAGVYLHVDVGKTIKINDPLFTIYSEHDIKLEHAIELANKLKSIRIGGVILEEVG
ncbi:MAG: AMP phosphorylase [Candidatus Altiarchaeales archaeon HGW-Altiarchaeales-3]|nr:MAG: AMP phosphorylase [Candidatus Altiarchaeales archaeon HGW-Altiarchaeales-3]